MNSEQIESQLKDIFSSRQVFSAPYATSLHLIPKGFDNERLSQEIPAQFVVFPEEIRQVQELIISAIRQKLTLLALGGRTHLSFSEPKMDVAINLSRVKAEIDHNPEDLTATLPAGFNFAQAQAVFSRSSQMIPLDYIKNSSSTVGGMVSANVFGPRRHRYGTARDWVIGTTLVNGEGKVVKAGGRVVKNVSGYDMNKLYIGARGTLGILTEITFKLHPLPELRKILLFEMDLETAIQAVKKIQNAHLNIEALVISNFPEGLFQRGIDPETHYLQKPWFLGIELAGTEKRIIHQTTEIHHLLSLPEQSRRSEAGQLPSDALGTLWFSPYSLQNGDYGDNITSYITVNTKNNLKCFLNYQEKLVESGSRVIALPEEGICVGFIQGGGKEQLIKSLIEQVRNYGGWMEFIRLSPEMEVDRWPILSSAAYWMKAVKKVLDPAGIFASGTFVAGI